MLQELADNTYQGILTSPEMCLQHSEFRKILMDEKFSDSICAVIIDEAHCISQWGGDFRKMYAFLEKLRAFFPQNIPFLATSATLAPEPLREVRTKLAIDPEASFYLNLGNDRPNIAMSVQQIDSTDDYDALRPLLAQDVTTPDDIIKSVVFVNARNATQLVCRRVRQFYPKHLRRYVDYLHAHRTVRAKRRVMQRFRQGKIKVLIATEAAGMVRTNQDV
jgi:bloom syndrome protein